VAGGHLQDVYVWIVDICRFHMCRNWAFLKFVGCICDECRHLQDVYLWTVYIQNEIIRILGIYSL